MFNKEEVENEAENVRYSEGNEAADLILGLFSRVKDLEKALERAIYVIKLPSEYTQDFKIANELTKILGKNTRV